jgi:chemotaxis protein CheX
MSYEIDTQVFEGTDPVYDIAMEVFAAMIDGEPGFVARWEGAAPAPVDELFAWVDVQGPMNGRVLLSTEHATAVEVTRALLGLAPDDAVGHADIVDALGEVANVVGGNVKSLAPDHSVLTLPEVATERPVVDGGLLHSVSLDWRGRSLVISLWTMP